MYYKSNPGNYTRCEKCKYIDREKEECKVTNDKWLVPDNAGTCHQFEEVKEMKVVCINNERFEKDLENGKIYKVLGEKRYGESVFYELESVHGDFNKNRFKKIIGEVEASWYCRDITGCLRLTPRRKYRATNFTESNVEIIDDSGELNQYAKKIFTNIKEYVEDFDLRKEIKSELDKQMEKNFEMAKNCGTSLEEVGEAFKEESLKNNTTKPNYYKAGKFDVITFCFEHDLDFATGNIIKYVTRAGKKDKNKTLEDLYKAMEYLRRKIEKVKESN